MKRALVLLTALSMVMVACGDDDGDGSDATTGGSTTVAAVAGTGGGSTPAGAASDYCTALAAFKTSRDEVAAAVASGTPEQIETAIADEEPVFMALVDVAPPDIADDLAAIAGPMDSLTEALDEVDYDVGSLTTDNAAAMEALNQLDGPDYIEATLSVDAYGLENCGITIGDWQAVAP